MAGFVGGIPVIAEIFMPFPGIGFGVDVGPETAWLALAAEHAFEIERYRRVAYHRHG